MLASWFLIKNSHSYRLTCTKGGARDSSLPFLLISTYPFILTFSCKFLVLKNINFEWIFQLTLLLQPSHLFKDFRIGIKEIGSCLFPRVLVRIIKSKARELSLLFCWINSSLFYSPHLSQPVNLFQSQLHPVLFWKRN